MIVFTDDPDADKIELAINSGVHAYVVSGYGRSRLRALVHLAQARFQREQSSGRELAELKVRFEERKLVDRAKGILMGARHLREDEAFKAFRTTAMSSKQRIGQVSQVVIETARYAEAMNRAGQLRMLSQRLVKLYAPACTGMAAEPVAALTAASVAQVEGIFPTLDTLLSKRTFGDLVTALRPPWTALRAELAGPARRSRLLEVDRLAEGFLDLAERLTANLELVAYAPALGVVNTAGRQRMLSQRLAKQAIMRHLLGPAGEPATGPDGASTLEEFLAGLDYLSHLPLSNAGSAGELHATILAWQSLQKAMAALQTKGGVLRIAESSETLLDHFDRLTNLLERGIQAFVC